MSALGSNAVSHDDKPAAVEMTRRFVEVHRQVLGQDFQLECEVRQVDG
ncbi:MAG TPA: hypothetical protein VK540_32515 [Polyangiaceae bacterium]|jgi:hypothetical protein|nr:hypothetical protein [Polyangiaceae bacterium]